MNETNDIVKAETQELLIEIFNAPLEKRSDMLLDCDDPKELVQQVAPEETFLIYQASDDENLPDLLNAMSPAQQNFIADFALWEKDLFKTNSFLNWLYALAEAGMDALESWLKEADLETLALGLGSLGAVLKRIDEETDMSELLPDNMANITLDDLYYFTVKDEANQDIIKTCLTLIHSEDKENYTAIMEGLINEAPSEIMENAFEFRQDRLSYFGFPDKETAFAILTPLPHEEFLNTEPKSFINFHEFNPENQQIIHYPKPAFSKEMLWDHVQRLLVSEEPDTVHQINLELIWLVNKVIVTEGLDNFTPQKTKNIMQKVKCILNIALEVLSNNDEKTALNFCKKFWLEYIFRLGMTYLTPLNIGAKKAMSTFGTLKGKTEREETLSEMFYEFLSPLFSKQIEGISKTIPQNYNDKSDSLAFFSSTDLIKTNADLVKALLSFFTLLQDINAASFLQDQKYLKSHFTIDTFVWTLFANFSLKEEISITPVTFEDLHIFAEKLFADKSSVDEYKNRFITAANLKTKSSLDAIINLSIDTFTEEIKNLKLNKTEETAEETNLFIMKY